MQLIEQNQKLIEENIDDKIENKLKIFENSIENRLNPPLPQGNVNSEPPKKP